MENDLFAEPYGKFPHRYTHDDRFQYLVKVQPVAGHMEFHIRAADTRLPAMAAERAFHGLNAIGRTRSTPVADESKRLDNQLRATQRAQRRIRLLCMEAGVDRLFTFTTRGFLTRDQLLQAWDSFRRFMEKGLKTSDTWQPLNTTNPVSCTFTPACAVFTISITFAGSGTSALIGLWDGLSTLQTVQTRRAMSTCQSPEKGVRGFVEAWRYRATSPNMWVRN